jgi:hypothetical protein
MRDTRRVATVRDHAGEPFGDAKVSFSHSEQHDAAVRRKAAAVKIRCDFLARDGWKREGQDRIVSHGGRGGRKTREGLA